ncbi:hypothetical protein [Kaistia sp. MMO-174]|uniref:hypothetical protein n=1 Tax=Kaistia sp. MMO-174 TaxID=3081256 RepID=UPI003019801B
MDDLEVEDKLADLRMQAWRAFRKGLSDRLIDDPINVIAEDIGMSVKEISALSKGTLSNPSLEEVYRALLRMGCHIEVTLAVQ